MYDDDFGVKNISITFSLSLSFLFPLFSLSFFLSSTTKREKIKEKRKNSDNYLKMMILILLSFFLSVQFGTQNIVESIVEHNKCNYSLRNFRLTDVIHSLSLSLSASTHTRIVSLIWLCNYIQLHNNHIWMLHSSSKLLQTNCGDDVILLLLLYLFLIQQQHKKKKKEQISEREKFYKK